MELTTCRNCLGVFGSVQTECPLCGADERGEGAEVELDGEARSAVQRLGGLFAAIVPAPPSSFVLWCARGVCRFDETVGLVWSAAWTARVEDVRVGADRVVVEGGGRQMALSLERGEELH